MKARRHSFPAPFTLFALLVAGVALTTGCAQEEEAPPPVESAAPERVENADFGLALADVPDGFDVVANNADGIVLVRKPELPPGEIVVVARPVQQAGVNLVQEVKDMKADFEAREGGSFNGQAELGGLANPAFTTRGRWVQDGQPMEEIHILTLHPAENRVVDVIYVYDQSGDTKDRMEQAMEVLGEVEAYDPAMDETDGLDDDGGDITVEDDAAVAPDADETPVE